MSHLVYELNQQMGLLQSLVCGVGLETQEKGMYWPGFVELVQISLSPPPSLSHDLLRKSPAGEVSDVSPALFTLFLSGYITG